jgi:ABC-type sugar transport system permease subunit
LFAPTTLFVSISSLQAFAQAFIITNGGPSRPGYLRQKNIFGNPEKESVENWQI